MQLTKRDVLKLSGYSLMSSGAVVASPSPSIASGVINPVGLDVAPLRTLIKQQLQSQKAPGTSIVVFTSDKIRWAEGFGKSDVETGRPMRPENHQMIGSITKTISTLAVMQLVERGALDLDQDISSYLPFTVRNPNHPLKAITLRQIVMHTSSLLDGPWPGPYTTSYRVGNHPQHYIHFAEQFYSDQGAFKDVDTKVFADYAPGEQRTYASVPWALVAYCIEARSGLKYGKYLDKNIFQPLGMTRSALSANNLNPNDKNTQYINYQNGSPIFSVGRDMQHLLDYERIGLRRDQLITGLYPYVSQYGYPTFADGGIWSSAIDLAKYAQGILQAYRGAKTDLLKKETALDMLTAHTAPINSKNKEKYPFGLGWRTFNTPDVSKMVWGHGGSELGSRTIIKFIPDADIGVVTFTNIEKYDRDIVVDEVLQTFLNA